MEQREPGRVEGRSEVGVPGLDQESLRDFPIEALQQSPALAVMMVRLYEAQQRESRSERADRARLESRSSRISTLLGLLANLEIGVGGALLASDFNLALLVIAVGVAQAILGVFLRFS